MNLRALAGRIRKLARSSQTQVIEWDTVRIDRVRSISARSGHAINKLGRIVLRGEVAGRPVKLYEAFSANHALFVERISAHDGFPRVVARHQQWLVAEWIVGEPPQQDAIAGIAELQARFQGISTALLPSAGFDLWSDFLRPRFVRASALLGASPDEILELVDVEAARTSLRIVSHPDLRPANLILRDTTLVSIDNETCATTTLPLLDVAHTVRAMGDHGRAYWHRYLDLTGRAPDAATRTAIHAAWVARLVGTAFVEGRIADAHRVWEDHRSGRKLLPF